MWMSEQTAIISLYSINYWFLYQIFNPLQPSGHYVYHQFNIHNSTVGPHSVFMCFVWIWEQTAILSPYNIIP